MVFMVCPGIYGISWYSMVFYSILWYFMVFYYLYIFLNIIFFRFQLSFQLFVLSTQLGGIVVHIANAVHITITFHIANAVHITITFHIANTWTLLFIHSYLLISLIRGTVLQ